MRRSSRVRNAVQRYGDQSSSDEDYQPRKRRRYSMGIAAELKLDERYRERGALRRHIL